MDKDPLGLGAVRRWKTGDILWAENELLRMAYVVTDNPTLVGTFAWHPHKDGVANNAVGVEYISRETGAAWDDGEEGSQ